MARPKKKLYVYKEIIDEIAEASELYYRVRAQGSVREEDKVTFISKRIPKTIKMLQEVAI